MGQIPSNENMVSTIITNPQPGDTLPANTNFTVTMQVSNLDAGTFTNPNTTYYAAPQTLNSAGNIIGHTHVTIQSLGNSLSATTPPDPKTFMFFKGIDNAGNGDGGLSVVVAGGLPAGAYRVCTMSSAANHQPVLMPVSTMNIR
jgi:transcription initiation factor TFIID subunit 15